MKKVYDGDIPFDGRGNQLHYFESWNGGHWVPNTTFKDTLTIDTMARGRSAAYFIFERKNGSSVVVFLRDAIDMMKHMQNGKVTGTFTFCKRGQNYGCKLVDPNG